MNRMQSFSSQKQRAINQINEMRNRATPPALSKDGQKKVRPKPQNRPHNTPLRSMPTLSDDTLIILGLILILSNDGSDTLLLLALAYILM